MMSRRLRACFRHEIRGLGGGSESDKHPDDTALTKRWIVNSEFIWLCPRFTGFFEVLLAERIRVHFTNVVKD